MPTVFITGGARRLGRGLALFFAHRGWNVGVTYHQSSDADDVVGMLQALHVQAACAHADVVDEMALTSALDTLVSQLGVPDVVVSNAGVFPPQRGIDDLTPDALRRTLDVNTIPVLTIARWMRGLPLLGSGDARRLICLSSLGAFEVWKHRIDYHTSKAAVVALVEALARECAPAISVNSVAPGAIAVDASDAAAMPSPARIPFQRHGTVDDVASAVWMFATGSAYITGQTVIVDGGYHLARS